MTGPLTALKTACLHALDFKGRATRSEFWWPYLLVTLLTIGLAAYEVFRLVQALETPGGAAQLAAGPALTMSSVLYLIAFIPLLSLSVRRLHDVGMSGFVILISFVPVIGWLALMVIFMMPSVSSPAALRPRRTQARAATTPRPKTPLGEHQRAMQSYAELFEKNRRPGPAKQTDRQAEISEYYRTRVLKSVSRA